MKRTKNNELIHKITLVGILTALVVVLSFIRIPILSVATIKLILPVVVVAVAVSGPFTAVWLAFVSEVITCFSSDGAMFMTWSTHGAFITFLGKGILYALAAGLVYKLMEKKHPTAAVFCSAIVAPIVNTGVFLIGCRIFVWENLVELAQISEVGMGMFIFGLAGMNFIIELILNVILCPSVLRIIDIAKKKRRV